jgi:hypothetical protein
MGQQDGYWYEEESRKIVEVFKVKRKKVFVLK